MPKLIITSLLTHTKGLIFINMIKLLKEHINLLMKVKILKIYIILNFTRPIKTNFIHDYSDSFMKKLVKQKKKKNFG